MQSKSCVIVVERPAAPRLDLLNASAFEREFFKERDHGLSFEILHRIRWSVMLGINQT